MQLRLHLPRIVAAWANSLAVQQMGHSRGHSGDVASFEKHHADFGGRRRLTVSLHFMLGNVVMI